MPRIYSGIRNGHHCRLLVRMVSGEILSKRLLRKDRKQLLLTDNRQSVTQGENDFLHTRIPRHQIIEGFDTDCLQVCAMGLFFQHMAIPQGIVGNDISTAGKAGEHHFIILYVFTLISVNKGKVKSEVQLRYPLQASPM